MISQSFTNIGISCDIIKFLSHVILDVKCESQYPSVQAIVTNLALRSRLFRRLNPMLSKHTVAYMEASKGLLAVSPYVDCPLYSCAKSVAEAVAAAALMDLNNLKHMISYLLYHIYYIT
jgi:hypothetical protein